MTTLNIFYLFSPAKTTEDVGPHLHHSAGEEFVGFMENHFLGPINQSQYHNFLSSTKAVEHV